MVQLPSPDAAGKSLDTQFTLSACDGWGDPTIITSYTYTVTPPGLEPFIITSSAACSTTAQLPAGSPLPVTVCVQVSGGLGSAGMIGGAWSP